MRSKGTTPRGWLARVVITLLMLEAAYLVGANGFLHSDWGRELLNRRPEKLTVAWQRAWTWLPGLVTFRRLELRGNARRASWQVTVERGRMLIWLPSLLLSEFSVARSTDAATLVQGQGLEMRLTNDSTAIDRPAEGIALEIALPEAEIPDLASFSAYLPEASGLEITGGQGLLAATLEYSAVEQSGRGLFTLSADRVEATFGDVDLRSRIRVDGILPEMLLDQGVLGIASSSVSIEDTEVVRGEGWWGRIELAEGTWTRAPADSEAEPGVLEGLVRAELRDTGPLVALLERYVPKLAWFDGLATVHNITAETRTRVQGSALRFEGLQVTGGKKERTEVLGELDLEGKSSSGVLFARWGPLSAAVALEEGDRDWKLTDSREWYERRARAYRGSGPGAAEVVEAPQGISP